MFRTLNDAADEYNETVLPQGEVIYVAYFDTFEEASEAMAAADVLGLGWRMDAYKKLDIEDEEEPDPEYGSRTGQFRMTLWPDAFVNETNE